MKHGIVLSSELSKHGRWDADFHLLNQEYAERAEALSATMSKEDALALLIDEHAMPTEVLRLIAPLVRGHQAPASREKLLKAAGEYPFLALAIIKDKGCDLLDQAQHDLMQKAEKMAGAKRALEAAGSTVAGLSAIPVEVRQGLNKNRYVGGVVYFDGDTLSIPVETSATAYVADCWVIALEDWTGPAMIDELVAEGNVPVPRRYEDLGKPIGFLSDLADHTQNYGMGWRG